MSVVWDPEGLKVSESSLSVEMATTLPASGTPLFDCTVTVTEHEETPSLEMRKELSIRCDAFLLTVVSAGSVKVHSVCRS